MNLPLSRTELEAAVARGERFKYVFFWGHKKDPSGVVSESCFSQWYAAPFERGGYRYATAEHYMMAEKARLFGDGPMVEKIISAASPGAAKALGREVRGFDQELWNKHRFEIVVVASMEKFSQNAELGAYLAGTSRRILVEASPRDRIWGIGMGKSNPDAEIPQKWRGQNLLGFALMAARQRLGS